MKGQSMSIMYRIVIPLTLQFFFIVFPLLSQTTGKISGEVKDARTGEPLIGANVLLVDTFYGAATNLDGYFDILNIPPGTYTVRVSMMGYHSVRMTEVQVSRGLTAYLEFELKDAAIELGEEVVIVAERPLVRRDLTATSSRVSADEISVLPVENIQAVINRQPGVVDGHFRGGRRGEVLYMIDGVPVTDVYTGNAGFMLETNAIQELEVISGTFNAEFGHAMSGVVNQVTREPSEFYQLNLSSNIGDYFSRHTDLFMNLESLYPTNFYDIQGSVSGPIEFVPNARFLITGRTYYDEGHLYGQRIFLPTDSSNFSAADPSQWYIGSSGDSSYVPMNFENRMSFMGKLTFRVLGSNRIDIQYLHQRRDYNYYDHRFRFNPEGIYTHFDRGDLVNASYTHVFSPRTFATLRGAWFSNRQKSYVYEDPTDPRYPPFHLRQTVSGAAFFTGGAEDEYTNRETRYSLIKTDVTSQVTRHHEIKAGAEIRIHRISVNNFGIRNDSQTNFQPEPVYFGRSHFARAVIRPREISAYVQDKIDYEDIVANIGVRFDYFDPNWRLLSEQLRLGFEKKTEPTEPEYQISPRFGLAFPISDRGVMHIAYGHFFQIPVFDLLYLNPEYNLNATDPFQVGNPGLKSQRTAQYEIGLQQELTNDLGFYVTAFYKDMRNLIGTEVYDITNGNKYSMYVNRDYGTARGFIVSFRKRHSHGFSATLDYTFQIAKGNASDPNEVFLDNITDPPRESQKYLIPLDWDRTHSIDFSGTAGDPRGLSLTILGSIYSGLPYTPSMFASRIAPINSEIRQWQFTIDIYARHTLSLLNIPITIFTKVYNLFDRKNELQIFNSTGRANYSVEQQFTPPPRGINTVEQYYTRPDFYSKPRQIIFGIEFSL